MSYNDLIFEYLDKSKSSRVSASTSQYNVGQMEEKRTSRKIFSLHETRTHQGRLSKAQEKRVQKERQFQKTRRFKKKAMAAVWDNSSDSDSESSSSNEEEEEANLAFMANVDDKERFATVKTKLCGHKAVDVADLKKNGIHNIVAAMERMNWTKLATLSEAEAAAADISSSKIEDIPPELIEPVGQSSEVRPPTQGEQEQVSVDAGREDVAPGHNENSVLEETPTQGEQAVCDDPKGEVVASGHSGVQVRVAPVQEEQEAAVPTDIPMENTPVEGENLIEKEGQPQGESTENPLVNKFQEGVTASSSDSDEQDDHVDHEEPVARASEKGKGVASEIPLLTETPHQRTRQQRFVINLKPLMDRLDAQGEILCSVQSDITSIFMTQSSATKDMGMVKNAVRWLNKEIGSMKTLLLEILKEVRALAPPAPTPPAPQPSEVAEEEIARPSGPVSVEASGPLGPSIVEEDPAGPSRPVVVEQVAVVESAPTRPAEDLSGPTEPVVTEADHVRAEEEAAPEPPAPSPIQTPTPPSPPSSSTAPPAPTSFKQPLPRTISSPTPFPSQSSPSSISTTHIPPPPPASSSSGPSSSGPAVIPPSTSHSFLHPSTPPSFITIIPESAQIDAPYLRDIKDEFEEVIL
ncbi:hypothetical protein Taro_048103 [Colocasia esculenta]|uniref:Uncharacterized protein n=1 Tax=Colocasia esculenta TaxID=4460 RepID=A0A843X7N4_COLES|nr:hypothetical protein [Colocasia esculenta]